MTATGSFAEASLQALLENIAKSEHFKAPKFCITNTTKPGENFIGRIFKVDIRETCRDKNEKRLSLIFKVSSSSEALKSLFNSDSLFRTESNIYTIVLPGLNNLLRKYGVNENISFPGTARCFGTDIHGGSADGLIDAIVLENKKDQNFVIADLKKGLDFVQCRLALEKLAIFHAASMAVEILEPKLAEIFRTALAGGVRDIGIQRELLEDTKLGFLNGLSLLPEPYTKGNAVYDKLYQFYQNFHEEFPKLYAPPEDLACIIHADAWTANMLFKLNKDGVADDICLIDYQMTGYSSPIIDISRVLLFCTTKELRDAHMESLLQFYFDEVTRVLRSLNCDAERIFPWSKFQFHLGVYGISGVVISIFFLPLVLAFKSDVKMDVHSMEAGTTSIYDKTKNIKDTENLRLIIERVSDIVRDAERWGFI